jgi:hypothetical protein
MNCLVLSLVATAAVAFIAPQQAAAADFVNVDTDVSIVANGTVVGDVRLPRNAHFRIVSDRTTVAPGQVEDTAQKFIASGNVTLVARVDGREVMTLRGDELVVTRRR